jgi:hypothetical protein
MACVFLYKLWHFLLVDSNLIATINPVVGLIEICLAMSLYSVLHMQVAKKLQLATAVSLHAPSLPASLKICKM